MFPDARFVMTHRDPADVIVSVADVYLEIGSMFSEEIDLHYLGALNLEHWSVGMERALAFRDRGNDHRFYDIDFRTMQTDPIGEVTQAVRVAGGAGHAGVRGGDGDVVGRSSPRNREQNVHPDPATFGLVLDDVRPAVRRLHHAHGAVDRALSRTRHASTPSVCEQVERVVPQPPRGLRRRRRSRRSRTTDACRGPTGSASAQSSSTRPPRPSSSGAVAAHIVVAAACATVLRIGIRACRRAG